MISILPSLSRLILNPLKHTNNRLKCSFIWLPFKTWNSDNLHCFNYCIKTNYKGKGRVKTKKRQNPANRPELHAHRGVLWGTNSDSERHREKQKKAKRMGSKRWPWFIGCSRPGAAYQCSGGAQCYRFNECKRGRRGLPLMLSSASEDAKNRGSTSHGGPGSGRGTCPGERRQEPFVWQGPEMELMLRTEGLCSQAQICWSTGGHMHAHTWRETQICIYTHLMDF